MQLTIGKLAQRTGLTVRTLHHYDAIGLLTPSMRSGAGYRLYGQADIERLHRILALREMGLSLTDIGTALSTDHTALPVLIERQIECIDHEQARAARLRSRLTALRDQLAAGQSPDLAEWLDTLELMTMYENYFSPEEINQLPILTDHDAQAQWRALGKEMQAAMNRGAKPDDADVKALARRWTNLIQRDTGHDPELLMRLQRMGETDPELRRQSGMTDALQHFVEQAITEAQLDQFARHLSPDDMQRLRASYGRQMHEWPPVVNGLHKAMAAAVPVDDKHVQALARRWMALSRERTGDDPATLACLREACADEPDLRTGSAIGEDLLDYVRRAIEYAAGKAK